MATKIRSDDRINDLDAGWFPRALPPASCCSPKSVVTKRGWSSTTSAAGHARVTTGWFTKVTYCDPEVASVGLREHAARDAGHEVITSVLRLEDDERAVMEGKPEGHVKLVADTRTGELLGGHIVGDAAGEMIHEVVIAMAGRVPVRAVADAIHACPTISEAVRGAFV